MDILHSLEYLLEYAARDSVVKISLHNSKHIDAFFSEIRSNDDYVQLFDNEIILLFNLQWGL